MSPDSAMATSLSAGDPARIRAQESLLILLNSGVLTGLIAVHFLFSWIAGIAVQLAVELFSARLLMQLLEWAWVSGRLGPAPLAALRRYAAISVWINVAFACLASLVSGVPHSHYIVLMIVPTIAAAFRNSWLTLVNVLGVVVVMSFVYVAWIQALGSPEERRDELFEAATDTLTYVAVAVMVRALAVRLRGERQRLRASLAELEQTRDRLVQEEKLGAVGRLSAGIAHEIRNPVGMIASAVATAQRSDCPAAGRD